MSTDRLYQFDPHLVAITEIELWRQELLDPTVFKMLESSLFVKEQFGVGPTTAMELALHLNGVWEYSSTILTQELSPDALKDALATGSMHAIKYHELLAHSSNVNLQVEDLSMLLLIMQLDFTIENLAKYYQSLYAIPGALIYQLQEACAHKVAAYTDLRKDADKDGVTTKVQRRIAEQALTLHYSSLLTLITRT